MSKQAILTIGSPGSGKSTAAKIFEKLGFKIVERDIMRNELCNGTYFNCSPDESFHKHYYKLDKKLIGRIEETINEKIDNIITTHDGNLILSNTNVNLKNVKRKIKMLEEHGFEVSLHIFNPDLLTLFERNKTRINKVSTNVIFNYYQKLQTILPYIKHDNIVTVSEHQTTFDNPCVICDIDGTLAHLAKDIDGNVIRDIYNDTLVYTDVFDEIIFTMVKSLKDKYNARIVFLTGRSTDCYDVTLEWLKNNLVKYNLEYDKDYVLHCRMMNDRRKDCIIKQELFETFVKGKYTEVLAVFDDRPQVVDMWNDLGLKVMACADQRIKF